MPYSVDDRQKPMPSGLVPLEKGIFVPGPSRMGLLQFCHRIWERRMFMLAVTWQNVPIFRSLPKKIPGPQTNLFHHCPPPKTNLRRESGSKSLIGCLNWWGFWWETLFLRSWYYLILNPQSLCWSNLVLSKFVQTRVLPQWVMVTPGKHPFANQRMEPETRRIEVDGTWWFFFSFSWFLGEPHLVGGFNPIEKY